MRGSFCAIGRASSALRAGEQQRELVAAEPEGLAVLAEACADLGEHPVSDRVPEEVVDALEVVDVDHAEREGDAARLCSDELAL